jgi:hypothetical protein
MGAGIAEGRGLLDDGDAVASTGKPEGKSGAGTARSGDEDFQGPSVIVVVVERL